MLTDYQDLIHTAILNIVKKILIHIQHNGISTDQCLYISFETESDDVVLSNSVKARYPKEITIVLQYQYQNLQVLEDKFLVDLSFNGIIETVEIPFRSLIRFSDNSVNFSLQLKKINSNESQELDITKAIVILETRLEVKKNEIMQQQNIISGQQNTSNIISLEAFKINHNKKSHE